MQLLAPVVRARKGEHTKLMDDAQKRGYVRVRIDGEVYDLDERPTLDKKFKHDIEIVVVVVSKSLSHVQLFLRPHEL